MKIAFSRAVYQISPGAQQAPLFFPIFYLPAWTTGA